MNKTHFIELTKYQHNAVRKIGNLFIREQAWSDTPWQVVDTMNFDTANILEQYHLRMELWDAVKEKI